MTKITCIGAGSYSFGLSTLITLLKSEKLNDAEIALVDTNQESLDLITNLAIWLNEAWDCRKHISSHSSHKPALKGTDFVISSLEIQPREALWQQDYELTTKYGVRQPYSENGGPGGFAHTARNVNTVLGIARDMEAACPDAWFINFTNPMHRLCYLLNEYTCIKTVGLCHQLAMGYAMIAKALAPIYGFDSGEDFVSTHADPTNHVASSQMASLGLERFKIKAAGLNHFSWLVELTDRQTGKDLYPIFREAWKFLNPSFEPLTQKIFTQFGLFPIPGDEHLDEYLPWMSNHRTQPWLKYDLSLYNWELMAAIRDYQWEHVSELIDNHESMEMFEDPHSEGAVEVIEGLLGSEDYYWEAANIPNTDSIEGLPQNAIVEVPAILANGKIKGEVIGHIPKGITALLQREVMTSQLCVDSIVQGDRQLGVQSLLLDPVVDDLDMAEDLFENIITVNKRWLPQFWD
ncbi:MAG: hypothetical protein WBI14_02880 [Anaerolineaceae bacterium]